MKSLASKLLDKVQVIENRREPEFIAENNDSESHENNVILLNGSEHNKVLSNVPEFEITISEAKERLNMLQTFVKDMMIAGVDYGFIPKCDKPSLFKSGGEKLCDIFGFAKHFEVIDRVEDWEKGLFHYEIMATLVNKRTGLVEAQGIGCCNTKERKYASQDAYTIMNTILKMAKKRGFIDAVLSATRTSGLFTQDLEDYENKVIKDNTSKSSKPDHSSTPKAKLIDQKQLNEIVALVNSKKIPSNKMKSIINERYKIPDSKQLNEIQANDLISYLKVM